MGFRSLLTWGMRRVAGFTRADESNREGIVMNSPKIRGRGTSRCKQNQHCPVRDATMSPVLVCVQARSALKNKYVL